VIFIIFGIVIFFVSREILTWYWKLNKIIRLLERIERNLRKEGVKYPDEEYDEEYFKNNKIKIPNESIIEKIQQKE